MSSWFDEYGGRVIGGSVDTPATDAPAAETPITDQHTYPTATPTDYPSILAWVKERYAKYGGMNPGLLSENPPEYWAQRIIETGGFTGGHDENYWDHRMSLSTPEWNAQNPEGPAASSLGAFKAPAPYQAPAPFSYPDFNFGTFKAPDPSQVTSDPAYQFRLKQGEDALQASAAARGTLRTGGTLKDILQYGQDYAASEYDKIYGRASSEFQTAYNNALGAYGANRANAYGNQVFNTQTGQWEYQTNAGNALTEYQQNYNAGQDEVKNLISYADIGSRAASNAPAPVPATAPTSPDLTTQGGTLSSFGVSTTPNNSPYQPVNYSVPPSAGLSSLYRPNGRAY